MPALNFTVFIDLVESGKKRQTIRRKRKRPIKVGDTLHLYTGMRTANCRKLGEAVCTEVRDVLIGTGKGSDEIHLDHVELDTAGRADLARRDGFWCASAMIDWFHDKYGLPFSGQVIRWRLL